MNTSSLHLTRSLSQSVYNLESISALRPKGLVDKGGKLPISRGGRILSDRYPVDPYMRDLKLKCILF